MTDRVPCSECGAPLPTQGSLGGLCPECLFGLALDGVEDADAFTALPTSARDPAVETPGAATTPGPGPGLRAGRVLGDRYRLLGLLGRGGMGEVWRAFDLKLRVEVALKALRSELLADEEAVEMVRREVRATRQVVSPNVCRVFDLAAEEDLELVSMEYVEGTTLAQLLGERGPLELREAGELASQFLAGLEAIHQAGLVHRDVKPENLMVTPTGRVVVMDFGIARSLGEGVGATVSGTPAYMAPEQARGLATDVRVDVFAAGIVLAEMLSEGLGRRERRQELWQALHEDPPRVPESPWRDVIARAVARSPEARLPSAGALARALEEVALRGVETGERDPYPGLAAFGPEDAEYFFGRELEVETLLRQLKRPRLRAVIGPSGAGKSSFLRAGLLPALPPSWSAVVCSPGDRPFATLFETLQQLAGLDGPVGRASRAVEPAEILALADRWRRRHDQALVVVDQFEELFTLNADEVQRRFAELLAALVLEVDVHVLVALRDDFLLRCQAHEPLRGIFSDLTPLGPPAGQALRRALVQPALRAGYRFEDERLVDDMLAEVAHERGALPLLAFAAAGLWGRRDRGRGLLTRAGYEEIAGVAGALAQHAEATLERIGPLRLPLVRELFRHLVTAQGTRVIQDRDELLSTVGDRQAGEEVLQQLVDARLLTSFEVPAETGGVGHRLEIIHESLLTAWPRLVRWRAEDVEGARLRDQLRQAARLWDERGRSPDLLWTGSSFQEFLLWRERQRGRLTATEEAFARAMVEQAGRRRRRRRLALAVVVAFLVGVSAVVTGFWRQAVREARRAEAQQVFTLGELELDREPTSALAYAMKSLELADTPHARRLALRALWRGPTAFALASTRDYGSVDAGDVTFSPDGRWLVAGEEGTGTVRLWGNDGSGPRVLPSSGGWLWLSFSADSRYLVATQAEVARIYALPEAEEVRRIEESLRWGFVVGGNKLLTGHLLDPAPDGRWRRLLKIRRLPDGEPETLGVTTVPPDWGFDVPRLGRWIFFIGDRAIYEVPLRAGATATLRKVVEVDERAQSLTFSPDGERIYVWGSAGAGGIFSRATGERLPGPRPDAGELRGRFEPAASPNGRWLAAARGEVGAVWLWDLAGPVGSEPLELRRGARMLAAAFEPGGTWLASWDNRALAFWPLSQRHPQTLRTPSSGPVPRSVALDPRGTWIAAAGGGQVWVWPLQSGAGLDPLALDIGGEVYGLVPSPKGDLLAAAGQEGIWLVPLDGRAPERLPGFDGMVGQGMAFDAEGRRLAVGGIGRPWPQEGKVIRIWDLETRQVQLLEAGEGQGGFFAVAFLPDGRLLSAGVGGLRLWDPSQPGSTLLLEHMAFLRLGPDRRHVLGICAPFGPGGLVGPACIYDLEKGTVHNLAAHGAEVTFVTWDPSGRRVVTGSRDGIVRVGLASGEEPHLLFGHERVVHGVAVDPEGRFIVSASGDGTVRLWPMPDEGPPLHTLPREELLARLGSLTNFRVIKDPAAPGGYRMDFEPFRGWSREPPSW